MIGIFSQVKRFSNEEIKVITIQLVEHKPKPNILLLNICTCTMRSRFELNSPPLSHLPLSYLNICLSQDLSHS